MVSSKSLVILSFALITSINQLQAPDPRYFQDNYCYNTPVNGIFGKNLYHLLSYLPFSNNATSTGFYNSSYGESPDKAYATGFCRGDLKADACATCLRESAACLLSNACTDEREAFVWYENCTLRYSNVSIYGIMKDAHTSSEYPGNMSSPENGFNQRVTTFLGRLRSEALSSGDVRNFASGSSEAPNNSTLTIYGLMQCSPDLSKEDCNSCLGGGLDMLQCCYASWIFVTMSCNIRYEPYLFFDPETDETQAPQPSATTTSVPPSPSVSDTTSNAGGRKIARLGQSIRIVPIFVSMVLNRLNYYTSTGFDNFPGV